MPSSKKPQLKLVIPREQWSCAGVERHNGSLMLHDSGPLEGRMCCLGHLCLAVGVPRDDLVEEPSPCDVIYNHFPGSPETAEKARRINRKVQMFEETKWGGLDTNRFVQKAIDHNDDESISARQREKRLIALFAEQGVKLRFTGKLNP